MQKQPHDCIIIAIAGASASGKSLLSSTIVNELKEVFGDREIGVITEDSYYKDQSHLAFEQRVLTNYDHPNSMDHDLLVNHLIELKSGNSIEIPQYSYVEHNRMKGTTRFNPCKVIILEGILLLTVPEIRKLLNVSIFVDAPLDICFIRRLERDIKERGRSLESVITQYLDTVRPMFLQFIESSKQYADIIVPKGGKNRIAIDIIKAKINEYLQS